MSKIPNKWGSLSIPVDSSGQWMLGNGHKYVARLWQINDFLQLDNCQQDCRLMGWKTSNNTTHNGTTTAIFKKVSSGRLNTYQTLRCFKPRCIRRFTRPVTFESTSSVASTYVTVLPSLIHEKYLFLDRPPGLTHNRRLKSVWDSLFKSQISSVFSGLLYTSQVIF